MRLESGARNEDLQRIKFGQLIKSLDSAEENIFQSMKILLFLQGWQVWTSSFIFVRNTNFQFQNIDSESIHLNTKQIKSKKCAQFSQPLQGKKVQSYIPKL